MQLRRVGLRRGSRKGRKNRFGFDGRGLENRVLLSTFYVQTTADLNNAPGTGPLSLREAIEAANQNPGPDTIDFSELPANQAIQTGPLKGVFVFDIGYTGDGPLPAINDSVTIDGYTAPGAAPSTAPFVPVNTTADSQGQLVPQIVDNARITVALDGAPLSGYGNSLNDDGLLIMPAPAPIGSNPSANPDGSTIQGLSIFAFPNDGVGIFDSSGDTVAGNFIGVDPTGIDSSATSYTQGNGRTGVLLADASNNTVGGPASGARNIISGNDYDGVALSHGAAPTMSGNVVQNNYIGLQADGQSALPNLHDGITDLGATQNQILGNAISGNDSIGIALLAVYPSLEPIPTSYPVYFTPDGNVLQGNTIGLDAAGLNAVLASNTSSPQSNSDRANGNLGGGLLIQGGSDNTVGLDTTSGSVDSAGAADAENNIAGNGDFGVRIVSFYDSSTKTIQVASANVLRGNMIGTNRFGDQAQPNNTDGIQVVASPNTEIGGGAPADGNVISGNNGSGINLLGAATTGTVIGANLIGVSASGQPGDAQAGNLGNRENGILVQGANGTLIGASNSPGTMPVTTSGSNIIAGNLGDGINIIGDAPPDLKPFNTADGSDFPTVPTYLTPQAPLPQITALSTLILGNYIGVGFDTQTTADWTTQAPAMVVSGSGLSNGGDGVLIEGAAGVDIGAATMPDGSFVRAPNTIANNGSAGIHATDFTPTTGLAVTQPTPILIESNLIGVALSTEPNPVFPQTSITTEFVLPNKSDGILIEGMSYASIEGNTIAGNGGAGIHVLGEYPPGGSTTPTTPSGTVIAGNWIGVGTVTLENVDGTFLSTIELPNLGDGVLLQGASDTVIGLPSSDSSPGFSNVIAGNGGAGVRIDGATPVPSSGTTVSASSAITALGNQIQNNLIGVGTAAGGSLPLLAYAVSNSGDGVFIDGASGTVIGGSGPGTGNVISGNDGDGVHIVGTPTGTGGDLRGTLIQGNAIGATDGQFNTADILFPVIDPFNPEASFAQFNGGSLAGATASNVGDGILIESSRGNTVGGTTVSARNLITGNRASGIYLVSDSTGNTIEGNYIGIGFAATTTAGGNRADGVTQSNSGSNSIEDNVLAGNGGAGIALNGDSGGNQVQDNLVGLTPQGAVAGNAQGGIRVTGNESSTIVIGGDQPGQGNIIAANEIAGINLSDVSYSGNSPADAVDVVGNEIGVSLTTIINSDGTINTAVGPSSAPVSAGNIGDGLLVSNATNILIGGTSPNDQNVVADNTGQGIQISGNFPNQATSTAPGVRIEGNLIGVAALGAGQGGNRVMGNDGDGVLITGSNRNTITGCVIAGNLSSGVVILQGVANDVAGNQIGTDRTGMLGTDPTHMSYANRLDGVEVNASSNNTIGGAVAGGNFIANNGRDGLEIIGRSTANFVLGNVVGTTSDGLNGLGNVRDGILVDGSALNQIGLNSADFSAGNLISGNGEDGIALTGGSNANTIAGNRIGTTRTGERGLGNVVDGIYVANSDANVIGVPMLNLTSAIIGSRPSNLLSGNEQAGIEIDSGNGNTIAANFIGTDVSGTNVLENGEEGVFVSEGASNTIGGMTPGSGNVISGQQQPAGRPQADEGVGIQLFGIGAAYNAIEGNLIGTDASGTKDLGNTIGVFIDDAPYNTIGGAVSGARNVISGNDDANVQIFGNQASDDMVVGDTIGLNAAMSAALNGLYDPNPPAQVGGDQRTVIGVEIEQAVHATVKNNQITGNFIGIEITGNGTLIGNGTNTNSGVNFSPALLQDFPTALPSYPGVLPPVTESVGSYSVVESNVMAPPHGQAAAANAPDLDNVIGVYVENSAGNLIGAPGAPNLIVGNSEAGIELDGSETRANLVRANTLSGDSTGVFITNGASGNTIGGAVGSGSGNIISEPQLNASASTGVFVFGASTINNVIIGNLIQKMYDYGVLFYDTSSTANSNRETVAEVTGSGQAGFRVYNGPVLSVSTTSTHTTTAGKKAGSKTKTRTTHQPGPKVTPHPKGPTTRRKSVHAASPAKPIRKRTESATAGHPSREMARHPVGPLAHVG